MCSDVVDVEVDRDWLVALWLFNNITNSDDATEGDDHNKSTTPRARMK